MKSEFWSGRYNLMLSIVTKSPHLVNELCHLVGYNKPNPIVPRETILWHTLESYNGCQLQHHLFMNRCRLLNPDSACVVISTEAALLDALER